MKSTVAAARLIQLVKTRATVVRLDPRTGLPGACLLLLAAGQSEGHGLQCKALGSAVS